MWVTVAVAMAFLGGAQDAAGADGCRAECAYSAQTPPVFENSFWNTPVSRKAPLSPQSSALVQRLQATIRRYGSWINTVEWSTPVYTVGPDQPTVSVALDQPTGAHLPLRQAFTAVPIPPEARPSVDRDAHMVILQPSTDRMWEFWGARKTLIDGWHARFGGMMNSVSQDEGYFPSSPGWGATATGLPLIGGLMRISELRAGRVDHVLSLGIPNVRAEVYAWPAQRSDGSDTSPRAIPEGTRFRLDPRLDIAKLGLPPVARVMARAAQRYGIIVQDGASAVTFYAEDPAPLGFNPYFPSPAGLFGGQYPNHLLAKFPWQRLQVLRAPLTRSN